MPHCVGISVHNNSILSLLSSSRLLPWGTIFKTSQEDLKNLRKMTGLKKTLGKSYKNLRNAKIGFEN